MGKPKAREARWGSGLGGVGEEEGQKELVQRLRGDFGLQRRTKAQCREN